MAAVSILLALLALCLFLCVISSRVAPRPPAVRLQALSLDLTRLVAAKERETLIQVTESSFDTIQSIMDRSGDVVSTLEEAGSLYHTARVLFMDRDEFFVSKVAEKAEALIIYTMVTSNAYREPLLENWVGDIVKQDMGSVAEFYQSLTKVLTATTEEEYNQTLHTIQRRHNDTAVESKLNNIINVIAFPGTSSMGNIYQHFIADHGCDLKRMNMMHIILLDRIKFMIISSLLHGQVEGNIWSDESVAMLIDHLYKARAQLNDYNWYCFREVQTHAKSLVRQVLNQNDSTLDESLWVVQVQQNLSLTFPWYDWVVSFIDPKYYNRKSVQLTVCFRPPCLEISELEWETVRYQNHGQTYFLLTKFGPQRKSVVVAWHDVMTKARGCEYATSAETLVYFDKCKNCSDDMLASDGALTSDKCTVTISELLYERLKDAHLTDVGQWSVDVDSYPDGNISWIAMSWDQRDLCGEPHRCSNHGLCRQVPFTGRLLCKCDDHYYGDTCQFYEDLSFLKELTVLLEESHHANIHFGEHSTDDDRYAFNATSISWTAYKHSLVLNRYLVEYGKMFYEAEQIIQALYRVYERKLSEPDFGALLGKTDIDHIVFGLENIILGKGLLVGEDFMTAYKKAYLSEHGSLVTCREPYAVAVWDMMTSLAFMDARVTEASLWFARWRTRGAGQVAKADILRQARLAHSNAVTRWDSYFPHWRRHSCPTLDYPEMEERFCNDTASFLGARVHIHCLRQMTPFPPVVRCESTPGELQWSDSPVCMYVWGAWSAWGACSVTCGGGISERVRTMKNSSAESEYRDCETQDCCQHMYDKHRCANGECIRFDQFCDGHYDCADRTDETNRTECTYIRDGDQLAFKSSCKGWLSCPCETDKCQSQVCAVAECADDLVFANQSNVCEGVVSLYLKGKDKDFGDAIFYGDVIALQYNMEAGWWMACKSSGNKCEPSDCPGTTFDPGDWAACPEEWFWIYSINKQAQCSTAVGGSCTGELLYPDDRVLLLYTRNYGGSKQTEYWVAGDGIGARLEGGECPGKFLEGSDDGCTCEEWTVYRER